MKALIVDDERLARAELRRLLSAHPDIVVAGEARNTDEAEARLADTAIDLLFLDIEMPGGTGFDLLERLDRVPLVIFTTAYDEYAVRAFDINALDYLLKPIRPERLAQTLQRTRATWAAAQRSVAGAAAPVPGRVFVRDRDRCWLIEPAEIVVFEAEGNYTRVVFGNNRPLVPRSLQSLELRLDPATFFRVSRSHIVNLKMVEQVETAIDGSYVVVLRGGRRVAVSRRQSKRLRENLSL
jgi:two-component system, LytTR family, response regulator